MLIRLEKIKDKNTRLVVDELERYLGKIHIGTFFKYCVEKEDTIEIVDNSLT